MIKLNNYLLDSNKEFINYKNEWYSLTHWIKLNHGKYIGLPKRQKVKKKPTMWIGEIR